MTFTPMRGPSIADVMLEEARAQMRAERKAAERTGMGAEALMKLERQIEATKERANRGENVGERLRELRRSHYEGNGSPGG